MELTLSRSSSEAPEKEIKLARDGLRLFRCRSKSRSCRTWAITSGNKVVLYFAAESEIQAQNWMQAVRDGLWPPCFSFQMLTACSYEVSLVDDDNTFMAGHLGVYGRFVLTSENVISLMHPHWGSTSLEISLDNIIDVLFIREAEISPAGVFSIILKRVEGSNVKALQFFCNTATDAMQWILSKLYARRKSFSSNGRKSLTENRVSFSLSDDSIDPNTNHYETLDKGKTIPFGDKLLSSAIKSNNITDSVIATKFQPANDNIQFSNTNCFQNEGKHSSFDKVTGETKSDSLVKTSEESFLDQSRSHHLFGCFPGYKSTDEGRLVDHSSNENIYENIIDRTTSNQIQSFKTFGTPDDLNRLSSEYANKKYSIKQSDLIASNLSMKSVGDESVVYAVVNKSNQIKMEDSSEKNIFTVDENRLDKYASESSNFDRRSSSEKLKSKTPNSSLSTPTSINISPVNIKNEQNKTKVLKTFLKSNISNDHSYASVNKNISNDSFIQAESESCPITDSLNDHRSTTKHNLNYLTNLPSNFLNTSLNTLNPNNKARGSSSSSEEDNEHLLLLVNEFDELKANDPVIYEAISERKGTMYEEIDESENECVLPSLNVPELPKRPTNLQIPESLRLQKLSRNIKHTLDVMEDIQSQKELRHTDFIKKIKDVSRIMQISPNKESLKIDLKGKADTRSEPALTPNALKTGT